MRKISEIFINGVCLKEILEKHEKWINRKDDGERANLIDANLSGVDLSGVNLSGADLIGANLKNADLENVDLSYADLWDADLGEANLRFANLENTRLNCTNLISANLSYAILRFADLNSANLRGADLKFADLNNVGFKGADLSDVDLRGANLRDADLRDTNLNKVLYNHQTSFFALICPEEGSFIGYKKANNKIVKLLITEDAERSSATTRKCRCSKAKVLSITNIENTEEFSEVTSDYDKNFIYKVGEIVEVKDYNKDRWNECSMGIHFFITRDEAIIYKN